MGGFGSGRRWHWSAKDTTDAYRAIDVRRWARAGLLEPGRHFGWQWSIDGEKIAEIRAQSEHGQVRLNYRTRSYGGDWEPMSYPVRLIYTPCNYGGERVWFSCPAQGCGRRVAKLYGGSVFACRHCHQLAYPSQREKRHDRTLRRAEKIRARLGWEPGIDNIPGGKPKGMHWRTYNHLTRELEYYSELADLEFGSHLYALMTRFGKETGP